MPLIKQPDKTEYSVTLGDGDGKADANILFGGKDSGEIITNINLSKWDDETFLNLNNPIFDRLKQHTVDFKDSNVEIVQGDVKHNIWTLGSKVLEYRVGYSSKPASNVIVLDVLCSDLLDWHYQPILLQEDIDSGSKRPLNVEGSYAVYFNKQHNKYKTGKFAHIYRWEVVDSDGRREWCKPLLYEDGKLYIEMPSGFLDTAVYPIYAMGAGDTLGLTTDGGSIIVFTTRHASLVAATSDGTVDDMNGWFQDINSGTREAVMGIYSDDGGGTPTPQNLIDQTAKWFDFGTGSVLEHTGKTLVGAGHSFSNGDKFHLVAWAESSSSEVAYDSSSGRISVYSGGGGFPTFPDPWSETSSLTGILSIYINFTPVAVGGRIMGALVGHGGLVGSGGIAGRKGGIAG